MCRTQLSRSRRAHGRVGARTSTARPKPSSRCSKSSAESLPQWLPFPQGGRDLRPAWPRKITLDGNRQSHWGLRRLRRQDRRWKDVLVRNCPYLSNIVEQDHRAIKGRCRPMLCLEPYRTAAVTLAGIELAHRIRKCQFKFGPGGGSAGRSKSSGIEPWHELGGLSIPPRAPQDPLTHPIPTELGRIARGGFPRHRRHQQASLAAEGSRPRRHNQGR
jgi:DDE domain